VEVGGRAQLARRGGGGEPAVSWSRVLGLVREQAFAFFFGAGRELDAFITAFRIPNLLATCSPRGALGGLRDHLHLAPRARGRGAAWRLANLVGTRSRSW